MLIQVDGTHSFIRNNDRYNSEWWIWWKGGLLNFRKTLRNFGKSPGLALFLPARSSLTTFASSFFSGKNQQDPIRPCFVFLKRGDCCHNFYRGSDLVQLFRKQSPHSIPLPLVEKHSIVSILQKIMVLGKRLQLSPYVFL